MVINCYGGGLDGSKMVNDDGAVKYTVMMTLPALDKGFHWFNEHKQSRDNDCEAQLHGQDTINLS